MTTAYIIFPSVPESYRHASPEMLHRYFIESLTLDKKTPAYLSEAAANIAIQSIAINLTHLIYRVEVESHLRNEDGIDWIIAGNALQFKKIDCAIDWKLVLAGLPVLMEKKAATDALVVADTARAIELPPAQTSPTSTVTASSESASPDSDTVGTPSSLPPVNPRGRRAPGPVKADHTLSSFITPTKKPSGLSMPIPSSSTATQALAAARSGVAVAPVCNTLLALDAIARSSSERHLSKAT